MMRKIIYIIMVTVAFQVSALNVVNNPAGHLSEMVKDLNITSLTVSGSMDASDFYFISDNLHKLTTLDLSAITVVACHTTKSHYWKHDFDAATLPIGGLAGLKVTTVKLPQSITVIDKAAMADCDHLTSLTLPASLVTIGDYAFAGCEALQSVNLPASVETVGRGAFMRCKALTSFTVAMSSQLKTLDATALLDCPSLTSVNFGPAVQSVGERALAGTGIQQLDLSRNSLLTTVGDWAMIKTPVAQAKFPDGLTELGNGAFLYDTNLSSIELGGNLEQLNDYLLAGTGLSGDLVLEGITRVGDYALYNVSQLSVVELPATLTWMGNYAMAGMTGMTALTSKAARVPELGENVWAGVNQQAIPLTVPKSSINDYKAAEQWKEFMFESQWLRGDVNGDGEVNIADINVLVDIIMGNTADAETMLRADVNEDGEINIADINAVLDIILSSNALMSNQVDTDNLLRLDDVAIRPGEERTLSFKLDNAQDFSALQCDIILPQGLSLVGVKASQEHLIKDDESNTSTSRVVTYSKTRAAFDDEMVLAVTVRADAALASDGVITLIHVVLADDNNVGWHAADYSARVSNSSGVEDLQANIDRVWTQDRTLLIEAHSEGSAMVTSINGVTRTVKVEQGVNRIAMEPGFYVVILNGRSYKIAIK